jgi:hypothetical protein
MNLSEKDMIRKSPGDQCTREVARRAGVDDRGRPTPAGSAEQLVFTLTILAKPKADVFSNGNPLSSSHASDGLRKTALVSMY